MNPQQDYSYYLAGREASLLEQPFSNHLGWQYITSDQYNNINNNFDNANGDYNSGNQYYKDQKRIWGRPSFVPEGCINFAGKEVTREEALFFAVPYHIEKESISPFTDKHQLCANYIERKVQVKGKPHKYKSIIVPSGLWQQVQTIESFSEHWSPTGNFSFRYNNKNCLGFRPNNNFLPYNRWFVETKEVFNKHPISKEEGIVKKILSYWVWWKDPQVNRQDIEFIEQEWYQKKPEYKDSFDFTSVEPPRTFFKTLITLPSYQQHLQTKSPKESI